MSLTELSLIDLRCVHDVLQPMKRVEKVAINSHQVPNAVGDHTTDRKGYRLWRRKETCNRRMKLQQYKCPNPGDIASARVLLKRSTSPSV